MHYVLDRLRFYTVLSIDFQTYHDFLFLHFMHPIATLHLPAETFLLWFCGNKSYLSSRAAGKCFKKPLLLFVEGESLD